MPQFLSKLKQHFPESFLRVARTVRNGFEITSQWPPATWHPWRSASLRQLANLKDIHQGERCFIIGNGPSLKQTELSLLRDEFTFGMNRIYLLFSELGFYTSYYVSVNNLVIEQCADEIQALPVPKFLPWRARHYFPPTKDTIYLYTTYTALEFTQDARRRLWEGATVTYVALQLAFHMGFNQAILIGVDHNFVTKGNPNATVVSEGEDPNHFTSNYFGKGFRWQLPDLETSEKAYRLAREAYHLAGRQVFDATIGGKLNVFPKVDYIDLF